jgi:hypothetical protein
VGEGEETTHRLISALENNKPYESIDGIGYRDGENTVINNKPPSLDIKHLPWPAYDLILSKNTGRLKFRRIGPAEVSRVYDGNEFQGLSLWLHILSQHFRKRLQGKRTEEFVEEMVMLRNRL